MEEIVKKPVRASLKTPRHEIADCYRRKGSHNRTSGGHGNEKYKKDKQDEKDLAYVAHMVAVAAAQAVLSTNAEAGVVASGATHHLATEKANFSAMAHADYTITTASDGKLSAQSRGDVMLMPEGADSMRAISLKTAYRMPRRENKFMLV